MLFSNCNKGNFSITKLACTIVLFSKVKEYGGALLKRLSTSTIALTKAGQTGQNRTGDPGPEHKKADNRKG